MHKVSSEKVILTDCDGVLLDWFTAFNEWMVTKGYKSIDNIESKYNIHEIYHMYKSDSKLLIREFNNSAWMYDLTPLGASIKYVRKLYEEHGFVFHCITSLSDDPKAAKLRKMNLENVFGKGIFTKIECLPCGADKDSALEMYRGSECFWLEDKVENADLGIEMGLRSILIGHTHNKDYTGSAVRCENWKEVYEEIVGV